LRAVLASAALVAFACAAAGSVPVAAAATAGRTQLTNSLAPAAARTQALGAVSAASPVNFELALALRDPSGAEAALKAVSDPTSASYRHYLTDAQWVKRYGPTMAAVSRAESWLRSEGFSVGAVAKDRLIVSASGTAAQVEKAFSTSLGYYHVNGQAVRLASSTPSIPSSIAGSVSGVVGVNQYVATPAVTNGAAAPAGSSASPNQEPPPPTGFRNPEPCSAYWGQKLDTFDSPLLYAPYTSPLPYDICGYKPGQLRSAYGLSSHVNSGTNGTGVALAIVDAYDSPTLLSDAQQYFNINDPSHKLASSQFFNLSPGTVDDEALCAASGWYDEQALDVESSHSVAPGANIVFVGAQDCLDASLLAALQTAVTSGVSVVSDSWGDPLGDLLTDAATRTAFDNTFMLAGTTGVSVLFSSGDTGDNFADFGLTAPDYPASSPFVTSVGGTSLEVNSKGARAAEYGWTTGKQVLCTSTTTNCGPATTPIGKLAFQAGGGGGTSYTYAEPYYQAGVVPAALALRNEALFGPVPLRVEPDMSMDADAQTGMLIGLTQTFPDGTYYDQFKEGGTSLASPLLAGVIADTDQLAGTPIGFLNPALYKAHVKSSAAFNDILPPTDPHSAAAARVDYANTIDSSNGYVISMRTLNYAGPETYCDGTGNCATRPYTLTTAPGFDAMTGLGSIGPKFVGVLSQF
jgi:subtilase family serine protease